MMDNIREKDLMPISRIVFRALMESNHIDAAQRQAVEFLQEAEELWQHKKTAQEYKHAGAYFLARTYQRLAKEKIIATDGRVLDGGALIDSKRLNGFLCRPRGFAPVNYQQTQTIRALTALRSLVCKGQSR